MTGKKNPRKRTIFMDSFFVTQNKRISGKKWALCKLYKRKNHNKTIIDIHHLMVLYCNHSQMYDDKIHVRRKTVGGV